jgi:uncharacterized protein
MHRLITSFLKRKTFLKKVLWAALLLFGAMNLVAFMHAWTFTHFSGEVGRTKDPKEISGIEKIRILLTGIDNPKPKIKEFPAGIYQRIFIGEDDRLACWMIKAPAPKGTIIMFHGYAGEKSSLLGRAKEFLALGYNTFLVDFNGSGESDGEQTSIGFHEAKQVRLCFEFLKESGEKEILLFGTSMGAAAVLKSLHDFDFSPRALILECPFGSLYETVCARFRIMKLPTFPMAGLLTFWGGVQHGYWAFSHNPTTYAHSVKVPTLILFGEEDNRIGIDETDAIYGNIQAPKTLRVYKNSGHDVFEASNRKQWRKDVEEFLTEHQ